MNLLSQFGDSEKRILNAIDSLKKGSGVLLVDDENRENEGDLIFSAQNLTVPQMAMLIRECSGIVCLCLTKEKATHLKLPLMVKENDSRYQTAFTVSIEAKEGVSTGVSASDRVQTILTASKDGAVAEDLCRPGHVFPLIAKENGVLEREGHTEGTIDLMKLSGLKASGVLCELTNKDGSMAKLPEVIAFAKKNDFPVLSIQDIIEYRKK